MTSLAKAKTKKRRQPTKVSAVEHAVKTPPLDGMSGGRSGTPLSATSLSPESLAIRSTGIGASEPDTCLGWNKYKSPAEVVLEKRGLKERKPPSDAMKRGIYLEPGIRNWYGDLMGCAIVPPDLIGTVRHPKLQIALATPDGIAEENDRGPRRCLEIKSPGEWTQKDWGPKSKLFRKTKADEFSDAIAETYVSQVHWQMGVTGIHCCDVAALIRSELYIYRVKFDEELFAGLYERVRIFWDTWIAPSDALIPKYEWDNGIWKLTGTTEAKAA